MKELALRNALEKNRQDIQEALAEAERELTEVEQRRAELKGLITRARAAIGLEEKATVEQRDLTLHEALEVVLSEKGDAWVSVGDLLREVNSRGLYRMKDGRPVEASQIHARLNNYADLFEKQGSKARLKFRYATQLLDPGGSYWAAQTNVTRISDDASMVVEIRLSYSAAAQYAGSPEEYVVGRANSHARKLVSEGAFAPDNKDVWMITTSGLERIQKLMRRDRNLG